MIKKELLLASWLEKLQKKWDNEEYYYDVEEATKVFKFVSKLTNDRGAKNTIKVNESRVALADQQTELKRTEEELNSTLYRIC